MAEILDGEALAARLRDELAREVAGMDAPPSLATILVGDDPASAVYVAAKRRACGEVGIDSRHFQLSGAASPAELAAVIDACNADPDVAGILCQLPLPARLDARAAIERIHPDKDVDGLTAVNAGRLATRAPGLRPCTPLGVMALLERSRVRLRGAEAVVIGTSGLVGTPLALMLTAAGATVTMCHRETVDLPGACRRAEVLVAAAGVPGLVRGEWVRPGATVIDVGITRTDAGLVGDVEFEAAAEVAGAITPVPGGVGPMTIASLLRNAVEAARIQRARAQPPPRRVASRSV